MGSTVLIVDAADAVRERIRAAIGLLPLCETILDARDGLSALKTLAARKVDVVITGILSGDLDTFRLLQSIKSNAELRETPVVLITSDSSTEQKVRALENGASDCLQAPFDGLELAARVKVQLKIRELQDELREKNAELLRIAATDALTRIHNRRYFMEIFEVEWAKCERFHHDMGLFILDIDHFKSVNDNFGHPEGDRVLVDLAQTLARMVRKVDLVARFGGEEFVILLPSTDLRGCKVVGEKIRAEIERTIAVGGRERRPVTVSLGLAHVPTTPRVTGSDSLLARADEALYRAKREGRNRMAIAE